MYSTSFTQPWSLIVHQSDESKIQLFASLLCRSTFQNSMPFIKKTKSLIYTNYRCYGVIKDISHNAHVHSRECRHKKERQGRQRWIPLIFSEAKRFQYVLGELIRCLKLGIARDLRSYASKRAFRMTPCSDI